MTEYINSLTGEPLELLWAVTAGLCSSSENVNYMRSTVAQVQQSENAQFVKGLVNGLQETLLKQVREKPAQTDLLGTQVVAHFDLLQAEDKVFMRELRMTLLEGIRLFEQLERDTIAKGGAQLIDAAKKIPSCLSAYYANIASTIDSLERTRS
jgi:hypothetical protein